MAMDFILVLNVVALILLLVMIIWLIVYMDYYFKKLKKRNWAYLLETSGFLEKMSPPIPGLECASLDKVKGQGIKSTFSNLYFYGKYKGRWTYISFHISPRGFSEGLIFEMAHASRLMSDLNFMCDKDQKVRVYDSTADAYNKKAAENARKKYQELRDQFKGAQWSGLIENFNISDVKVQLSAQGLKSRDTMVSILDFITNVCDNLEKDLGQLTFKDVGDKRRFDCYGKDFHRVAFPDDRIILFDAKDQKLTELQYSDILMLSKGLYETEDNEIETLDIKFKKDLEIQIPCEHAPDRIQPRALILSRAGILKEATG